METYREMKDRHQKECDALPVGAAYSDKQFMEMMEKFGLCHGRDSEGNKKPSDNDLKQIVRIYSGVFMKKSDVHLFHEWEKKTIEELDNAVKADETGENFVYQMFLEELNNHEYGYTGDATDAIESLGFTWHEIRENPKLLVGFTKARDEIIAYCESNDW